MRLQAGYRQSQVTLIEESRGIPIPAILKCRILPVGIDGMQSALAWEVLLLLPSLRPSLGGEQQEGRQAKLRSPLQQEKPMDIYNKTKRKKGRLSFN